MSRPGSRGVSDRTRGVRELRLVVTAVDYDAALVFYRDILGLREQARYESSDGRVAILDAGRATLEIADPDQAAYIDAVEVGRRVAGPIRVAFQVDDAASATNRLARAGANVVAQPTRTPWNSLNARLDGPAGLQLTLFQELGGELAEAPAPPRARDRRVGRPSRPHACRRMRLVDSHCHLNAEHFTDDADEVAAAAATAGVERLLVPGWDVASSRRAVALVGRLPHALAAVGVHPHAAAEVDAAGWTEVVNLANDAAVAAIGETGLDFDRMWSPAEAQLENLRRNLALALATGKPAILHCRSKPGRRDAQDALLAELRAAGFGGAAGRAAFGSRPPAVLHSVSGPVDYVEAALELGCAVSVSGLAFRVGEEATAEAARRVPRERLLVETDAPYLSPPGAPRRRNEPRYVEITARWVAGQRGEDPDEAGAAFVAAYDATFGTAGRARRPSLPADPTG